MKFNHNKNQRSFTFAALLSLCAITASITNTAIQPLSKSEAKVPHLEQQEQIEEKPKQFDLDNQDNDQAWEEVELDQEWDSILGDESGEEILLAQGPTI